MSMPNVNSEKLKSALSEKGVLIAAHRGTCGGNIIQNTIGAYENAIKHGADIVEVDVVKTVDGEFFTFHTGQEPGVIGTAEKINTMNAAKVSEYYLINGMQEVTTRKINRLSDVLEQLRGKCFINIDRSWFFQEDIIRYLEKFNMNDQIILKSPVIGEKLKILEESGSQLMYMPIANTIDEINTAFSYDINMVGAEVVFTSEDSILAQPGFIEDMHKKNILLWSNGINLDDKTVLSAGHDDDHSILSSMDEGWGWLINRGYDIIQTDWPLLLKQYISQVKPHICG